MQEPGILSGCMGAGTQVLESSAFQGVEAGLEAEQLGLQLALMWE